MHYVRLPHDRLQKDRQVLQAVLNLAHGGNAGLPQQVQPGRGPVIGARPPILDLDAEADRLRVAIENGRATESDLRMLFFAL
jgi:hypothetical protein